MIPIIIAGGMGSRLWPLSREAHPKPLIKLADGQSLLQKTFLRASAHPDVAEILTVAHREVFFHIKDEYESLNSAVKTSYILEPCRRNTAPAITAAALHLAAKYDKDTILLILPADHLIPDLPAFVASLNQARQLAADGFLVTFGIKPHKAETGYGYLEMDHGHHVLQFVEKPNRILAQTFLTSGRHLWNSGIFCFSINTLSQQMSLHAPALVDAVERSLIAANNRLSNTLELDEESFSQADNISIDYALMEKANCVAAVSCDFHWNDIGSWNSFSELVEPDEQGNRTPSTSILHQTTGCYIYGNERVIATSGVSDLIIVDTPDALLIADKNSTQNIKHVVDELKHSGSDLVKLHRKVYRPWGSYTILDESEKFKIKRIQVNPGSALSLQLHYQRSEHWTVIQGVANVINGDQEFRVHANESTYIPAGQLHRLENSGTEDLIIIEVQSGNYLGEDDIVRFEDRYGREIDNHA